MVWCGHVICYYFVISITLQAILAQDKETSHMNSEDAVCQPGTYGMNCSQRCGKCRGFRCNPVTGGCPRGCQNNWVGALCRTYCGTVKGCDTPCGNCLGGDRACDFKRGVCKGGCLPGWTGIDCSVSCPTGLYGTGCRTVCGQCKGGNQNCNASVPVCKDGCERGFTGAVCNAVQEDCHDLSCRCGQCFHGPAHCDVISVVCLDGCTSNYTGKSCELDCPESQFGDRCQYKCDYCSCGCESVTGTCLQCRAFDHIDQSDSTFGGSRTGRKGKRHDSDIWVWLLLGSTALSALILCILLQFSWSRSKQTRRYYVQNVFNRLTADDAFRFVNPLLEQRSRRVKEPQFDVNRLSNKDREDVMRELDCLLGTDENYEDFVRSSRYRELRVVVANKAWATDKGHSGVDRESDSEDSDPQCSSKLHHAIHRWRLKLHKSIGSPVDPHNAPGASILKDRPSTSCPAVFPSAALPKLEPRPPEISLPHVRFSSAASMVIFPEVPSTSTSTSTLPHDPGVLDTLSNVISSFISSSSSPQSSTAPDPSHHSSADCSSSPNPRAFPSPSHSPSPNPSADASPSPSHIAAPIPSSSQSPASSPSSVDVSKRNTNIAQLASDVNANSDIRCRNQGLLISSKVSADGKRQYTTAREEEASNNVIKNAVVAVLEGKCFQACKRTFAAMKRKSSKDTAPECQAENFSSIGESASTSGLLPAMYSKHQHNTHYAEEIDQGEYVNTLQRGQHERVSKFGKRIRMRDSICLVKVPKRDSFSEDQESVTSEGSPTDDL